MRDDQNQCYAGIGKAFRSLAMGEAFGDGWVSGNLAAKAETVWTEDMG